MVQIKCLSNGLYSLKNSHIPFGMGFHPPLMTEFGLNSTFLWLRLPLKFVTYRQRLMNMFDIISSKNTCYTGQEEPAKTSQSTENFGTDKIELGKKTFSEIVYVKS